MILIKESVNKFALVMERKLNKNIHKGHWGGCTKQYLMTRLSQEKKELSAALKSGDEKLIAEEAADVANFAMMIAENFGDLK